MRCDIHLTWFWLHVCVFFSLWLLLLFFTLFLLSLFLYLFVPCILWFHFTFSMFNIEFSLFLCCSFLFLFQKEFFFRFCYCFRLDKCICWHSQWQFKLTEIQSFVCFFFLFYTLQMHANDSVCIYRSFVQIISLQKAFESSSAIHSTNEVYTNLHNYCVNTNCFVSIFI